MGTDKGLMMFRGRAIIQHIIEQLQPAVGELVIVSDNPAYSGLGLETIADTIKDIGPAGGISSALSHSKTEKNFILGCDTPFIRTAAIEFIIGQTSRAGILLPVHEGRLEPLFGIYSKACVTRWDEFIRQGFLKLHELVTRFDLVRLETGTNPLFSEPFFVNINTPEDFEKALINTNL